MKLGIDVSYHQGNIDWQKVAMDNIEFAILRLGYHETKDEKFLDYVKGCKENGIEIKGVYLFSYALNEKDAEDEANFAVNLVKEAGLPESTLIFFDLEYDSIRYAKRKGVHIGKEECMSFTKVFCDRVIELGHPAGVYFNLHYYKSYYTPELLSDYEMWLADWTGEPDLDVRYHQFSETGSVAGIQTNVDMNRFYGEDIIIEPPVEEMSDEDKLIKEILEGEWGNGTDRKKRLVRAGHHYGTIQGKINTLTQVAENVIKGKYGNGDERKENLKEAGYNYELVQLIVNQKLK